jgi:hypothetical protein
MNDWGKYVGMNQREHDEHLRKMLKDAWKRIINPITHCRRQSHPHFFIRPEAKKMKILLFFGKCIVNRSLNHALIKQLYA